MGNFGNSSATNLNKELSQLLADLHRQVAWRGAVRAILSLSVLLVFAILTLRQTTWPALIGLGIVTGFIYASIFVTTHDALHHTFSGVPWIDELVPRLISYPALWFHGTYKELHLIHHRGNGSDLADPERPQYSIEEYAAAGPVKRWYIRHQWFLDLFVLSGFGFIAHHVHQALTWGKKYPRVRKQFYWDLVGLVAMNGAILALTAYYGVAGRYLVLYLCLERVSGMVHQFRAKVEHYGLWGKEAAPLETQIYGSRNISTSKWGSFYMNGLNFHSIHHAFPRIPYYHLKEADARLRQWAEKRNRPLPTSQGYLRTGWKLATAPELIDDATHKRPASRPIAGFEFGPQSFAHA